MALRTRKNKDISQEKQGKRNKQSVLQTAKGKNGLMSTGMIAIVVAIVILFNLAVGQLPSSMRQFDLSSNQIYEISDTTKDYLAELQDSVKLTVIAEPDKIDSRISRFLERYVALSDQITMETIDPVAYPSTLTEYECEENSIIVQCEGKEQSYTISFDDILVPDYYSYYYGQDSYSEFDGDGQLTSAIDAVVSSTSYQIYTLTNHGEASLGTQLTQRLTKSHFQTEELSLLREGKIPDDCEILLLNQPTKDLAKDELKLIRTYLKSGGQVSLILPNQDFDHPNLDSLMKEYGLELTGGYAGDTQRYYTAAGSYLTFFPELDVGTEVAGTLTTDDLALVDQVLAMKQVDAKRDTITVTPFLTTSENGLSIVSQEDYTEGQYIIGATASEVVGQKTTDDTEQEDTADSSEAAEDTEEEEDTDIVSRLTVLTANTLVDDSVNSQFGDAICNLTLYLNTLTCAVGMSSNISIPAKSLETATNTITHAGTWSMLYLVVLPLVVLIGGFMVWRKRRKL